MPPEEPIVAPSSTRVRAKRSATVQLKTLLRLVKNSWTYERCSNG